jgi:SPP1 gp7 family putative phage head morphogenesis protein
MPPTKTSQLSQLEERADQSTKALTLIALALLRARRSVAAVYSAQALIAAKLARELTSLRTDFARLANQHADTPSPPPSPSKAEKQAARAVAANLAAALVRSLDFHSDPSLPFRSSVRLALRDNAFRLARAAETEGFHAYNRQRRRLFARREGVFVWNATLDKRTCPTCSARDGKRYRSLELLPDIPAHPHCRCVLDFIEDN